MEVNQEPSKPEKDSHKDTYVLVLPWAQINLDEMIGKERIAGYNVQAIQQVLRSVATALKHLHERGIIHGDVKPKVRSHPTVMYQVS